MVLVRHSQEPDQAQSWLQLTGNRGLARAIAAVENAADWVHTEGAGRLRARSINDAQYCLAAQRAFATVLDA